jgi:hypothetical protein
MFQPKEFWVVSPQRLKLFIHFQNDSKVFLFIFSFMFYVFFFWVPSRTTTGATRITEYIRL